MEELEKRLEEIKINIQKLKEITDELVKQGSFLDRLDELEKIEKEVIK